MQSVSIVLPIFLIIFAGWTFKKTKVINNDWIEILNRFAYYVALPAIIVNSFWNLDFTNKNILWAMLVSLVSLIVFSFVVILILSLLRVPSKIRAALFLSSVAGNTIYIGFPVVKMALGESLAMQGVLVGVIYLIMPILISIFVIKYWCSREHGIISQFKSFLTNPLTISFLAGIVASFLPHNSISEIFRKSFELVGSTASPVALFALGGFMHGKFLKQDMSLAIFSSILKVAIFPIVVFVILIKVFSVDFDVFILLASMPSAVTSFIISERFGLRSDIVGNAICLSTLISFISIPVLIYILQII